MEKIRILLIKLFSIYLVSVVLGYLFLAVVYAIPTDKITKHVRVGVGVYTSEGLYPRWAEGKRSTEKDNFTDAIMLSNAIYTSSDSPWIKAALNPKQAYSDKNPLQNLSMYIDGQTEGAYVSTYSRYWHGYLTIVKPALYIMLLGTFTLLHAYLQIFLMAYLLYLVYKRYGTGITLSLLLAFMLINPVTVAMSLQFTTMFMIATVMSIVLIKKWNYFLLNNNYILFFFVSGILTAYFDFLTYPLVSLGIPLTLLLVGLYKENRISTQVQTIKMIAYSSITWSMGYVLMYISKWVIAALASGGSEFDKAMHQLAYRMSNSGSDAVPDSVSIGFGKSVLRNLDIFSNDPLGWFLVLAFLYGLYRLIQLRQVIFSDTEKNRSKSIVVPLIIIALMPIVWYIVLSNHSYIHSWFTYRSLSISVLAVGCLYSILLGNQDKEYELKETNGKL